MSALCLTSVSPDNLWLFDHWLSHGVGPDRCMTTSGQRYSPISVHMLHANSACTTSVQEGWRFWYSFWTILVQLPSAIPSPRYASTQSDHSVTPSHHKQLTQTTQMMISGFFDFGHTIPKAVIVHSKQMKQRVMHPRQLSTQRQMKSIIVHG